MCVCVCVLSASTFNFISFWPSRISLGSSDNMLECDIEHPWFGLC